jgi:hypothetical protein
MARLIKAIAECPQFKAFMSDEVTGPVQRMVLQGAYYKSAVMEDPMTLEM